MTEIGPGTKGLVIHQRFLTEDNLGILLECTLLKQHGVPCKSNRNVLIQLFGAEQYIFKSRTNVVINELVQEDRSQQILLSQQTDYSWSQTTDVGFGGMGSNLEDM